MKKNNLLGIVLLLIASILWGLAFIAQSVGTNHLNAFAFNSIRSFIGVLVLLPVLFVSRIGAATPKEPLLTKDLLLGGTICGVALTLAANFQQMGIEVSTVGKSAFITTLYIVLVPIGGLFFKKRLLPQVWVGIVLAFVGLFLLCMKNEAFVLELGDIYLLLCAFFFTIQIMCIDHFAPKVNGIMLSIMQFFVTAVLSGVGMLFTQVPSWADIQAAAIPLIYAGAVSCGVAYTLQIIGQKHLPAAIASLVMSLESVVATLAGWLLLHEILSEKELLGCALVFAAVILTQLPLPSKKQ